jgi:hypothetical protein
MEMEDRFATVTVTVVEPLSPFTVALIVAVPDATPVTNPVELTVAMVLSDVDQLAESVTVSVVPLSYVPVATICCVLPTITDGVEGDTVTVVKVGPIKKFLQPAVIRAPSTSSPQKAAAPRLDRITFRLISTTLVARYELIFVRRSLPAAPRISVRETMWWAHFGGVAPSTGAERTSRSWIALFVPVSICLRLSGSICIPRTR